MANITTRRIIRLSAQRLISRSACVTPVRATHQRIGHTLPFAVANPKFFNEINGKRNCSSSVSDAIPIALYEEIKELPAHPEKMLIDVREAGELIETGSIPTSINIPLGDLALELSPSAETSDFKRKYGREKPKKNTVIIFSCKMGRRAQDAAEIAMALDYKNVKNYKGSWIDWAKHQGLK